MLFWLLVLFILAYNLLLCAFRLYEKARKADWERRFYQVTWAGVRGYLIESLSTLVIVVLWMADWVWTQIRRIWAQRKTLPSTSRQGDRPVILCHGYHMRGWTMAVLAFWLRTMGRSIVVMPTFTPGRSGIRGCAAQLTGVLLDVLEETGADAVDLVGHSMGGLIVRACVAQARRDARSDIRVGHLVALATPHRGIPFWAFTWGDCGLDMKPESSFLQWLGDDPIDLDATDIFSSFDAVVPEESAGGWDIPPVRKVLIDGTGHLSMIMLPSVARQVFEVLKA